MSVRRSLFILTVLTIILPVAVFAMRANRPQNASANLQTYTVQRGDVDVTVSAVGKVDSERSANLSFTTPGRIVSIAVQQGDQVKRGDVLAQLDDHLQQIALQQAQLALQLAQVQKAKLLAGPDQAQLEVAQANVNSAMGAVRSIQNAVSPDDLQAAQLAYDQAQAALADAQHNRAFGSGTQSQVDLLDAKVGEASFNAQIALLNLQSLQNGQSPQLNAAYARVNAAQAQLNLLKAGPGDADVSRADAQIAQAQVALDRAQTAEKNTRLTAPFDGVITSVAGEDGALVAPGVAVMEIDELAPLHLVVQVDEVDVRQIKVGLPATVTLDALPNIALPASLESIALVPSNDNGVISYDVTVRLTQDDPRVRVGMTASASFVVLSRQNVLIVPNQFIRLDRQHNQAFVDLAQTDGTLKEIPVTLGLAGQDRSEVTSGLQVGNVIGVDLSADKIALFGG
ncbi:MAG TPA: efflux RND transporter periplasmic adaptor subunit [Phototrophicaceae bacterium]|nr:efflux RND transporter periplasmic adaptor subunit [Phototrophicaceae bacterium]